MTTLALVDLDNVFGTLATDGRPALWVPVRDARGSAFRWAPDDGRAVEREPVGHRTPCVVAFAANTRTLTWNAPDTSYLGRLARRVARVLGHVDPSTVEWELAITLPVPQSADRTLVQMLTRAASPHTALTFDAVAVVSSDRGLTAAVHARLGSRWGVRAPNASRPLVTTFTLPRSWTRRYAETEAPAADPVAPTSGVNGVRVETPEACAWASRQPAQREATLMETARAVERHPAVLTQLSVTRASFRGLSRLLARRDETLGPCAPADGLELAVPVAVEARARGEKVRSSSLGPGAVQVEPLGATVHTALPTAWLMGRAIDEDVLLGPALNRLADADLLARELPLRPHGWVLRVALTTHSASPHRSASLAAEVLADEAAEVQGWWTTEGARRPKSCRSVEGEGAEFLVTGVVRTVAQQAVLADGVRRELIVMAPPVDRVTTDGPTARGVIAQATEPHLPFALLCLDADLEARQAVPVVPIQTLSAQELSIRCPCAALSEPQWDALRRLPIVVPAERDPGVRSVPSPTSSV